MSAAPILAAVAPVVVTLPWPPSTNSYWGRSRFGIYLKPKGREYRELAMAWLKTHAAPIVWQPCAAHVVAFPPLFDARGNRINARRPEYREDGSVARRGNRWRDSDNCEKAAFDALTHARVIADDSLIDYKTFRRGAPNDPGMLVVTIEVLA